MGLFNNKKEKPKLGKIPEPPLPKGNNHLPTPPSNVPVKIPLPQKVPNSTIPAVKPLQSPVPPLSTPPKKDLSQVRQTESPKPISPVKQTNSKPLTHDEIHSTLQKHTDIAPIKATGNQEPQLQHPDPLSNIPDFKPPTDLPISTIPPQPIKVKSLPSIPDTNHMNIPKGQIPSLMPQSPRMQPPNTLPQTQPRRIPTELPAFPKPRIIERSVKITREPIPNNFPQMEVPRPTELRRDISPQALTRYENEIRYKDPRQPKRPVSGRKANKPLFVRTDLYKEILGSFIDIRENLKEGDEVIFRISNLHKNQSSEYLSYKDTIEDIQRKLIYIDKTIFEQ